MRRNIQRKLKTDKEKTQAEMLWHLKLHNFYKQW